MPVILVTNDDGIDAIGIKCLAKAMIPLGEVLVVAPTVQRSGESKSLTFSRPLRVAEVKNRFKMKAYSVDGTPADTVIIGKYLCNKEFGKNPDLIVSGINSGDNTSVHALLTSGTCAAAFEGALIGISSLAFSLVVKSTELFFGAESNSDYTQSAKIARKITKKVLSKPLPNNIRFLNVNFPSNCSETTPIKVSKLAPEKYTNDVIEATDPRGVSVYWIWGDTVETFQKDSDSYNLKRNFVTITPISLGFGRWALQKLEDYF